MAFRLLLCLCSFYQFNSTIISDKLVTAVKACYCKAAVDWQAGATEVFFQAHLCCVGLCGWTAHPPKVFWKQWIRLYLLSQWALRPTLHRWTYSSTMREWLWSVGCLGDKTWDMGMDLPGSKLALGEIRGIRTSSVIQVGQSQQSEKHKIRQMSTIWARLTNQWAKVYEIWGIEERLVRREMKIRLQGR